MMKNISNKKIAIIGAGPGGLTLARLLQMNGADVQVYERDAHKDARPKGATLDLHEDSGLKALSEAGLMEAFKANYRPGADRLHIYDKHVNLLLAEDINKTETLSRPEIDRGPLQNILLDSLKPATVVWGSQFIALNPDHNGWQIEFKNSPPVNADIVIAADGANSKIRPYITSVKPFYSGVTMIEGAIYDSEKNAPKVHELLGGGKIFALGDSKSLIVSSKGDGSLVFYTGHKTSENWWRENAIDYNNKNEVLAWFKQEFEGWDDVWSELFENASVNFVPRPQYCMPLDQTWPALPNLTMLGDAAHLMPPYAGEGVNMAMLDALELSQCLLNNDYPNVQKAIESYENQMRFRASETARLTLESTDALHSPDAIPFLLAVVG